MCVIMYIYIYIYTVHGKQVAHMARLLHKCPTWSKIDLFNRFLEFLTKYGELGGPQATETYCRDETDLMEHAGSSEYAIQYPKFPTPSFQCLNTFLNNYIFGMFCMYYWIFSIWENHHFLLYLN